MRKVTSISVALFTVVVSLVPAGCRSTYYKAWEKLGWAKRDILVDRIEDARDDQQKAKEQFQTTLERFRTVTKTNPTDLEQQYKRLKSDYDRCVSRAKDVTDQIASVEQVANDMFKEWQDELGQYSNADLRRNSEQQLRTTRQRYEQLLSVMKQAESKMHPVLVRFNDQVLVLKHNLNAQAIAQLQSTAAAIEKDVAALIADMERSINEANTFIKEIEKQG